MASLLSALGTRGPVSRVSLATCSSKAVLYVRTVTGCNTKDENVCLFLIIFTLHMDLRYSLNRLVQAGLTFYVSEQN